MHQRWHSAQPLWPCFFFKHKTTQITPGLFEVDHWRRVGQQGVDWFDRFFGRVTLRIVPTRHPGDPGAQRMGPCGARF